MGKKIKDVSYTFDPFRQTGISRTGIDTQTALAVVAEFVKTEVLNYIGSSESPVEDGAWKTKLTKGYLKQKRKISSVGRANLELTGALLDDLDVVVKGNSLTLQVEGAQAPKADGNNRGSYGKARGNRSKAREFIPKRRQKLKKEIIDGISEILEEHRIDGEGA